MNRKLKQEQILFHEEMDEIKRCAQIPVLGAAFLGT